MRGIFTNATVVMLCLAVFCGGATAQSADEAMALVFDPDGVWPYNNGEVYTPVTAYLVLRNPVDASLYGFEAAVTSTDGELLVGTSSVAAGGVNSLGGHEFSVLFETPLATTSVTVLATMQIVPVHHDECIVLTGVSSPSLDSDLPLIWPAPSVPRPIETFSLFENGVNAVVSGSENPVLIITDPPWVYPCSTVVSTSMLSWGALKAKFY